MKPSILVLANFVIAGNVMAQTCGAGQVLLKNDILPGVPGLQTVSVIAGLCVGDAIGAVFNTASMGPVRIESCAVAFMGPPGSLNATASFEIYDGVTFASNGVATLGPQLFNSQPLFGPTTLTPPNITEVTGLGAVANIVASSGRLVVAWRMISNPNEPFPGFGCIVGYTADFATDNTIPPGSPTCNPVITPPLKNLIFDPAQGWWDVTRFTIGGTSWCPLAYQGNWIIRACVQPTTPPPPPNPLSMTFVGSSNVLQGSTVFLSFNATNLAGNFYFAAPSFTLAPPGSPVPLSLTDPLLTLYLAGTSPLNSLFVGFQGTIGPNATAGGIIYVPVGLPASALPLPIYLAFATASGSTITGISPAATLTIN